VYLNNYEYFLAIVEEGNITRAAERLYLTQPSLSKYLKRLEEELGTELFSRKSYPLELTEAGMLYKEYLEQSIALEKRLQENLSAFRAGDYGTVKIGMTEFRSGAVLPVLLPRFKKSFPNIKVEVYEGNHQQMLNWLEHDVVDFTLMHYPNSFHGISMEFIADENIVFMVNAANPILKQIKTPCVPGKIGHMSIDDFCLFRDEPFLLGGQGQNIREITDKFLSDVNIVPRVTQTIRSGQAIQNLVYAGVGNGFANEIAFGVNNYRKDLCYFTLGEPKLHWKLSIAHKSDSTPSIQAQKLILMIRSLAEESRREKTLPPKNN